MTKINTRNPYDKYQTQEYVGEGSPVQITTNVFKGSSSQHQISRKKPFKKGYTYANDDNFSNKNSFASSSMTNKGSKMSSVLRNSLMSGQIGSGQKGNPMSYATNSRKSNKNIYLLNDCLFMSNSKGHLEEWSISKREIHRDWGQVHKEVINVMKMTPCGSSLLTADINGNLKQWSIQNRRMVWDYGKAHKGWISTISITPNSLYAFTGGEHGQLKQWSVSHHRLWKDFDGFCSENIYSSDITNDGKYLFVSSGDNGNIKMMSI